MQTFSNLQRNITDKNYISIFFLTALFILYTNISVLSQWLIPFFGVATIGFCRTRNKNILYAILLASLFFENTHSLYIFSTWIFFFVFSRYIMPFLESMIDCKKCLNAIGAGLAYVLFFGTIYIISAAFTEQAVNYSLYVLCYWILFEMSISSLIFYAR